MISWLWVNMYPHSLYLAMVSSCLGNVVSLGDMSSNVTLAFHDPVELPGAAKHGWI